MIVVKLAVTDVKLDHDRGKRPKRVRASTRHYVMRW